MKTCTGRILECAADLRKTDLRKKVDSRLTEFREAGKGSGETIFKELCFCLLTANYSAEGGMRIQKTLGDGFLTLKKEDLEKRLRELGHRFPRARAEYIVKAREHSNSLKQAIDSVRNETELREWLVRNVKGLGYKEASHFLRNIGFGNLAIIDFHIIDILAKYNVIKRPKTLTRRRYLEIESVLRNIAGKLGMSLAELDLYLWFAETGKLLK